MEGKVRFPAGRPPLVACDGGGRLVFWDAATGKQHPHFFAARVNLLSSSIRAPVPYALSPDGKTAAVMSDLAGEQPIVLWDFRTGKELRRTAVRGIPCAFSPDGAMLAVRSADGTALVDTRTGRAARRIQGPAAAVQDIAFSPDGHMLATAGDDGTVRLWETASGQERRCFKGHGQRVLCVAFSPDGKRLASGSDDLTALVWDVYGDEAKGLPPARTADALWADLADAKAERAFAAVRHLLRNPEQTVTLARTRVPPGKPADPKHVRVLLSRLDSPRFAERDRARAELVKAGQVAYALLEKAAGEKGTSLEFRRRLEQILEEVRSWPQSREGLRILRLIEALENNGSAEARQVLGELVTGPGGALQVEAARAALRRLP
jgi:hypothetical protein